MLGFLLFWFGFVIVFFKLNRCQHSTFGLEELMKHLYQDLNSSALFVKSYKQVTYCFKVEEGVNQKPQPN